MNRQLLNHSREKGISLILTLAIIVLVTIAVVGLVTIMTVERSVARGNFESRRSDALDRLARNHAIALIREGTTAGSQRGRFWASQPGRITVFNNQDGSVDTNSSRDLYSKSWSIPATSVDLNESGFYAHHPIESSGSPFPVEWINVLNNPASPAGSSNAIVGRYAFWVDDESVKVNVNTANGTMRGTVDSFGPGTPTEVRLDALAGVTDSLASSIAAQSKLRFFNSPQEVLQASAVGEPVWTSNDFWLTHYSRSPDINIFGEPKISLVTGTPSALAGSLRNAMLGEYGLIHGPPDAPQLGSGDFKQIYPNSQQLPASSGIPGQLLPQTFQAEMGWIFQRLETTNPDYAMGMRIARYLKGYDSQSNDIQWPVFPGSGVTGFAGKYTDRQIDSIALQILSLMKRNMFTDQMTGTAEPDRGYSLPVVMPKGFLSNKLVRGLNRGPRVNEIVVDITTVAGSSPTFTMAIYVEWVWPEGYAGTDPDAQAVSQWSYGGYNFQANVNFLDTPATASFSGPVTGDAPLGGRTMTNLLRNDAGINFFGLSEANGGSGPDPNLNIPIFFMNSMVTYGANPAWRVGDYHVSSNLAKNLGYKMDLAPGQTSVTLSGGLTISGHSETGLASDGYALDPVPLESLRGPFTGENLADSAVRAEVLKAVIPLNVTIPIPGHVTIHMEVADPLTNSFPDDWVVTPGGGNATMPPLASIERAVTYSKSVGQNVSSRVANGGDPASIWMPTLTMDATKSQRFSSVGNLQYLHTGLMPDPANEPSDPRHASGSVMKGTPHRRLNFSPSTDASQKTEGGQSYPDWAMLDLFTVPAALQPLDGSDPLLFTWGGASAGRLNPNIKPAPFSTVLRTTPLQALTKGVKISNSFSSSEPVTTIADEAKIAAAVQSYLSDLGRPFMVPGEICNVPEVAEYLYANPQVSSRSRNDLVRQIVGNLSTQSNTFSVWTISQSVQKRQSNTNYQNFEKGDVITGQTKMHYIVERYLDMGVDDVPGNTLNPGPDGIVGTLDDPIDGDATVDPPVPGYHPKMGYPLPYKYRVIYAETITN